MIKIIEEKPDQSVVKQVICPNCGVKLEYTPADLRSWVHHDYGGGSETYHGFDCPKCHECITID